MKVQEVPSVGQGIIGCRFETFVLHAHPRRLGASGRGLIVMHIPSILGGKFNV